MKVEVAISLPFPVGEVWKLAGGFDLLPAISTATASSRLEDGGRIRVLVNRDGSILWERMLRFDEAERVLAYEITDAKAFTGAYGAGYRGEVRVSGDGPVGSVFHYAADFEPASGFTEEAARAAVTAFCTDCVAGIVRVLQRGS